MTRDSVVMGAVVLTLGVLVGRSILRGCELRDLQRDVTHLKRDIATLQVQLAGQADNHRSLRERVRECEQQLGDTSRQLEGMHTRLDGAGR